MSERGGRRDSEQPGKPEGQPEKLLPGGKKPAMCHPDKPAFRKGMCQACYKRQRREVRAVDKPMAAAGAGASDASEVTEPGKVRPAPRRAGIQLTNPKVARHVAKVAIKHQMDVLAAVREMKPDLPAPQQILLAREIDESPEFQYALQVEMESLGIDESSKDRYLKELWAMFLNGTEKERIAGARILGRAFIKDTDNANKPQELPIKDFAGGVQKMLGMGLDKGVGAETSKGDTKQQPGKASATATATALDDLVDEILGDVDEEFDDEGEGEGEGDK